METSVNAPQSLAELRPQKRFMTVVDLADYLGISEDTVYTMVSQRSVPFTKVGRLLRFDRKAIDLWLEKHSVKPIKALDGRCQF